ncbi:MAG: hypothetical protein WA734_15315, partial [Candidatus Acidiferrales bacterium]
MGNTPNPALGDEAAYGHDSPPWLKQLQDWQALAWPALGALLLAMCNFFGYLADSGTRAALGIYGLNRPSLSQEYVVNGAQTLGELGLVLVSIAVIGTLLREYHGPFIESLPGKLLPRLVAISESQVWVRVVFAWALAMGAFGTWTTSALI